MAKDLPYFKFFVSEWNDGDITLEDLHTQGLFINVCSYYWSNDCCLHIDKLKKRFKHNLDGIDKLFKESIMHNENGYLAINFLDEQLEERKRKSKQNAKNGAKGGRPKKQKETEKKPNALISLSETKGNKKREEEKREEKIKYISLDVLKNESVWLNAISKNHKIEVSKVYALLEKFYQSYEGVLTELSNDSLNEIKKHFNNWISAKKKSHPDYFTKYKQGEKPPKEDEKAYNQYMRDKGIV